MAHLESNGYSLTVFTDFDVYTYYFDELYDARERQQDYLNAGCHTIINHINRKSLTSKQQGGNHVIK